jgi:hypothetical protein
MSERGLECQRGINLSERKVRPGLIGLVAMAIVGVGKSQVNKSLRKEKSHVSDHRSVRQQ